MCYSISIMTDLKNTNLISYNNELLKNIASNIPNTFVYNDYELSGINNYVKNNHCSTIIEITSEDSYSIKDIVNIIELIIHIKELTKKNEIYNTIYKALKVYKTLHL